MALTDLARSMKEAGKPVCHSSPLSPPGRKDHPAATAARDQRSLSNVAQVLIQWFLASPSAFPWLSGPLCQVIGLAAGEPDFDTPAPIVEARSLIRPYSSHRATAAALPG